MFVSYTNVFFDMALQGRDQFHSPGTGFLHDYAGFCAQPVWSALGKKWDWKIQIVYTLAEYYCKK